MAFLLAATILTAAWPAMAQIAPTAHPEPAHARVGVFVDETWTTPDGATHTKPSVGALVVIHKADPHNGDNTTDDDASTTAGAGEPVARGKTNEHGVAEFRLPLGQYIVRAEKDSSRDATRIDLQKDTKAALHLYFKRDAPTTSTLHVVVTKGARDAIEPASGAKVTVQQMANDGPSTMDTAHVQTGITDARGHVAFDVRPGHYLVTASDGNNTTRGEIAVWGEAKLHLHLGAGAPPPPRPDRYPLGVTVWYAHDDMRKPAPGVALVVYAMGDGARTTAAGDDATAPHDANGHLVARGKTDRDGHARFDLPRGKYLVHADDGVQEAREAVALDGPQRIQLVLEGPRDAPDRPAPMHALGLIVMQKGTNGPMPAAGAEVVVYKAERNTDPSTDAPATLAPVLRGTTDQRGVYTAILQEGVYVVKVTDGIADAGARVYLHADLWKRLMLGGGDQSDPGPRPMPYDARPAGAGHGPTRAPPPSDGDVRITIDGDAPAILRFFRALGLRWSTR